MKHVGIHLRDVDVVFHVRAADSQTLRGYLRAMLTPGSRRVSAIHALRSINLRIDNGERVGLIGVNGAGKSTLLKLMAGIYHPVRGRREVTGRISPLFELMTGFEMELSGWENIRLRSLLLGIPPAALQQKLRDIALFSELGDFLDYPMRTYSAGMFIRLSFSIFTAIEPEILLLDEVVGAGDAAFAHKTQLKIRELIEQGMILVLATHNLDLLRSFCRRIVWLDHGAVVMDGPANEVIESYLRAGHCEVTPLVAAAT